MMKINEELADNYNEEVVEAFRKEISKDIKQFKQYFIDLAEANDEAFVILLNLCSHNRYDILFILDYLDVKGDKIVKFANEFGTKHSSTKKKKFDCELFSSNMLNLVKCVKVKEEKPKKQLRIRNK